MRCSSIKIVSGGQAGVDRGALDAALAADIDCGGWCPLGRKEEDGIIDQRYPLQETDSADYLQRTRMSVQHSDATVIIYFSLLEGGTKRTWLFCKELVRPCLLLDMTVHDIDTASLLLQDFVRQYQVKQLNVAGPRATKVPVASEITKQVILAFLQRYCAK